MDNTTQLLTYQELASALSVNVRTVSRWVSAARRCTGTRLVILPSEIVELSRNRFRITASSLYRMLRESEEQQSKSKKTAQQVKDNANAINGVRNRLARKGLRPNF